ncbi:MAG: hypothetical protein DMF69_09155 [Acidobacteria bacterium]|nr:MAG: hypothetical protein DMF69_09155 [Acidobacteriota bacterium]
MMHYYQDMDLRSKVLFLLLAGAVSLGGVSFGCRNNQTPAPKRFSASDIEKLRWIEGTWRGTGDVPTPFFERYRFENPTRLAVDSFPDEKLSTVEETSVFELKDGQFGNGGEGSRWIATSIDYQGITFEPLVKAQNSFRWQRESDNSWTAILNWPATEGKPARQRVYKMERWPQK